MKFRNTLAVLFIGLCSMMTAQASVIAVIDDFTTSQGPLTATLSNTPVSDSVLGSGIIGGERDLSIEIFADDFNQGATVNVAFDNFFFSTGSGVEAQFTLQWDGADNSMDINPFGLGGINFADGADFSFVTYVVESDLNAWFDVTFWSGTEGTSETVVLPIPGVDAPGRDTFFTTSLFTQTDFTNVGAIQVRGNVLSPETQLRQRSYDLQLGQITAVSEPAPILLSGLGLASLLLLRRRV